MGYSTQFKGILKFAADPSPQQLAELNKWFAADVRDKVPTANYVDFKFAKDYSGIQWSNGEKFYGAEDVVNFLIAEMRKRWPDFTFTGELLAQGDDIDDRWRLRMVDGLATKVPDPPTGRKVTCPHCERQFTLE